MLDKYPIDSVEIIDDKIEYVTRDMFDDYLDLKRLTLLKAKEIGEYAFTNNISLEYVNVSNATTIRTRAFHKSQIKTIIMPKVEYVDLEAFCDCGQLSVVSGLENAEVIGAGAFSYNNNLRVVVLPRVKEIGVYAFANCRNLEKVFIPETDTCYCRDIIYRSYNAEIIY